MQGTIIKKCGAIPAFQLVEKICFAAVPSRRHHHHCPRTRHGGTENRSVGGIARSDSARGTYYKSISGHEWGDAHQYELSVDSSIGPEKTAELICGYISHI